MSSPVDRDTQPRDDRVEKLREDMDQMPGVLAGQRRLVKHDRRVFPAFESLDLGISPETALTYLQAPSNVIGVPEENRGKLLGFILAWGITCVEAERERVKRDQGNDASG